MAKQLPIERFNSPTRGAELRASFEAAKRAGKVRVVHDGKVVHDGTGKPKATGKKRVESPPPVSRKRTKRAYRPGLGQRGYVSEI